VVSRRDLAAIAAVLLLPAALFWRVLFDGATMPPGGGDFAAFVYPNFVFAARWLQQGTFPLWNPHFFAGAPFQADVQTGLFYPLNLLALLTARPFTYRALELLAIAHYGLTGLLMWLYLRRLGCGSLACLAGAAVWQACGFLVAHLGHYNMLAVAAWLPGLLLALEAALPALHGPGLGRAARPVGAAALVYGLSALAGHTQMTLYLGLAAAIYLSAHLLAGRDSGTAASVPRGKLIARGLTAAALVLVLGGGIAAVQYLPTLELTRVSVRAAITFEQGREFALSPAALLLFLAPGFFGSPQTGTWYLSSLTESYTYAGTGVLVLASAGVLLPRPRLRRPALLLAALAAGSLLLALGDETALYGWLWRGVPSFDRLRAAGRFLVLTHFALAALAAFGLDGLRPPWSAHHRLLIDRLLVAWGLLLAAMVLVALPTGYLGLALYAGRDAVLAQRAGAAVGSLTITALLLGLTLGLVALYRSGRLSWTYFAGLMLVLLLADLHGANGRYNPTSTDILSAYRHPEAVQFLTTQQGIFRVDSDTGIDDIWHPSLAALAGYESTWGLFNPLGLAEYQALLKAHIRDRSSRLYQFLNARYLVVKKGERPPGETFRPVFLQDPRVDIYENTQALPRAFVVYDALVVDGRAAALAAVTAGDFDPVRTVVLERSQGEVPARASSPQPAFTPATLEQAGPGRLRVRVHAAHPGWLVLSEVWYRGWQARVDGRPAPVRRANWIFRAVPVDAGEHTVELLFAPATFAAGGVISVASLLACLALLSALPLRLSGGRARAPSSRGCTPDMGDALHDGDARNDGQRGNGDLQRRPAK
jgi:hypothetical protein